MTVDIVAKAAEANRFLERIGVTTNLPPVHYEPEVIRQVLESGGDFDWVPGGLSFSQISKLGTCPLVFLKDTMFGGLATQPKWVIGRHTTPDEQQARRTNHGVSIESILTRNLMCRGPKGEYELTRILESCYLIFLADFRMGFRPGTHVTVFPLNAGDPLDPKSFLPPWVMGFHGEDEPLGGLDIRILPLPSAKTASAS